MRKYNIKKRTDGRYEGRMTINGKRHSVYGRSEAEVKRKLQKLRRDVEKGIPINGGEKLKVALETYLVEVKKPRVMETTYDRVENTFLHHIKPYSISEIKIGNIQAPELQSFLTESCNRGLSESSVKKVYNLLGEFFRYMTSIGELKINPMLIVELPHPSQLKSEKKELEILTDKEFSRVIKTAEHCTNGTPDYRYGEVIILMLNTGIRAGECRGIMASDIDMKKKTLHIQRSMACAKDRENGGIKHIVGATKTRKSNRIIPLNKRAMLSVKRLMKTTYNPKTGYLVCTANGKVVTHSNLSKQYSAILKKAKVKHVGIHSTRHTFATMLLKHAEGKGQIKEVSEVLGHAQVSTTYSYYIATSNEDKRGLVEQLDNHKKWGQSGVKKKPKSRKAHKQRI